MLILDDALSIDFGLFTTGSNDNLTNDLLISRG
jgi:hypothetical protein